jgi:hypothetical protein
LFSAVRESISGRAKSRNPSGLLASIEELK